MRAGGFRDATPLRTQTQPLSTVRPRVRALRPERAHAPTASAMSRPRSFSRVPPGMKRRPTFCTCTSCDTDVPSTSTICSCSTPSAMNSASLPETRKACMTLMVLPAKRVPVHSAGKCVKNSHWFQSLEQKPPLLSPDGLRPPSVLARVPARQRTTRDNWAPGQRIRSGEGEEGTVAPGKLTEQAERHHVHDARRAVERDGTLHGLPVGHGEFVELPQQLEVLLALGHHDSGKPNGRHARHRALPDAQLHTQGLEALDACGGGPRRKPDQNKL